MNFSKSAVRIFMSALFAVFVNPSLTAGTYNQVLSIGDPLPGFHGLPATDGSELSSDDLHEEVLVLVAMANHCPWVRGGDRDLIELVAQMKGKSVRFVGFSVNLREDDRLPAMREHASKVGYNFTYVFDESQELGRKLGAARTPEFFVFNGDRELVYTGLIHNSPGLMQKDGTVKESKGEPTELYLKNAILATLAGEPVPIAETRAQGCNVEYK